MKEKSVEMLASLLNKTNEEVNSAIEKDELGTLVEDFKTSNQILSAADYVKLKENISREVVSNLKEDQIPEEFKSKAVGWKLEKLENEIKEKYQFSDDYKGLTDLVDRIVTKTGEPQSKDEVRLLKQQIVDLESNYKSQLSEKEKAFEQKVVNDDFQKAINNINLDYEGEAFKKQAELLSGAFRNSHEVKMVGGQTVVLKDGEILKDSKLDPLKLDEVMQDYAKSYGFQIKTPDSGGHGGDSSTGKSKLIGVPFNEYLASKDIKPNTNAADDAYIEWKKLND